MKFVEYVYYSPEFNCLDTFVDKKEIIKKGYYEHMFDLDTGTAYTKVTSTDYYLVGEL